MHHLVCGEDPKNYNLRSKQAIQQIAALVDYRLNTKQICPVPSKPPIFSSADVQGSGASKRFCTMRRDLTPEYQPMKSINQ